MVVYNNILAGAAGSGGAGYEISRSLRFNSGDSSFLSRTPSSAGNRKTFTLSAWIKRSGLTAWSHIYTQGPNPGAWDTIRFDNTNDVLYVSFNGNATVLQTDASFRDTSAWYHVVVAVDTTQSTSANRVKIYVNGVEQSVTGSYPTQNQDLSINNTTEARIGLPTWNTTENLNGYLADVHFIDGQQLAPTNFGELDDNNVWQPKNFSKEPLATSTTYTTSAITSIDDNPGQFKQGHSDSSYSAFDLSNMLDGSTSSSVSGGFNGSTPDKFKVTFPAGYRPSGAVTAYFTGTNVQPAIKVYTVTNSSGTETRNQGQSNWSGSNISTPSYTDITDIEFYAYEVGGGPSFTWRTCSVGGTSVSDNKILSLTDGTGLSGFAAGDEVQTGVSVVSVDTSSNKLEVDGGTWSTGNTVSTTKGGYGTNGFKLDFSDNSSNAALGTDSSGNGTTLPCVDFDGTGDYLSFANHADFALGTGDFTVECFVNPTNNVNYRSILENRGSVSDGNGFTLAIDASDKIYIYSNGFLVQSATGAVTENKWYHVAYVRNGSTHALYLDGVQVSTSTTSKDYTSQAFHIGATAYNQGDNFAGFISNVRIVKGTAVYTAAFTAPTAPLTNITNTKLLCCQSSSSATTAAVTPGTITANGDASATSKQDTAWTVNNLTAAVVPVDVGGDPTVSSSDKPFTTGFSVAFDGNDKMRMEGPGTVSGDFTWECWVKFTGTPSGRFFSAEESVNGTEYSLMRFYNGNLNIYVGDGNGYEANTYTGSVSADTWHHIAMVRSGTTVSHYLDGSRWGTNTYSNSFVITTLVLAHGYGSEYFTGSVSNARFVNGQALYTGASYTVPTATLTTTSQSATATNVTTLAAHKALLTANDGTKIEILNSSSDIDSLIDTPTNYEADSGGNNGGNYATISAVDNAGVTLSNGNLEMTTTGWQSFKATIGVTSGKWYWETQNKQAASAILGVATQQASVFPSNSIFGSSGHGGGDSNPAWTWAGQYSYFNGTSTYTGQNNHATADIIMYALDLDNGKLWFGKNGTWYNSSWGTTGNPATGANPTVSGLDTSYTYFPAGTTHSGGAIYNFGARPFIHDIPTGFKSLCTQNLPDPTIADGSTAFDIALWSGTGSSNAITSLNTAPDFVWIKSRNSTGHHTLVDAVRGPTKALFSNRNVAQVTDAGYLSSFDSNGFTVVSDNDVNGSSYNYVGWAWDAGASTVSNTDGSITTNVRANASTGFSIAKGNFSSVGDGTLGHGLNAAPTFYIIRNIDSSSGWYVYTTAVDGTLDYAFLNGTDAFSASSRTSPTSSVIQYQSIATGDHIAYCWTPVAGYSAFGSYTGNGDADGPFIYTGFRPKFILRKQTNSAQHWHIADAERDPENPSDSWLFPNLSDAEGSGDIDRYTDILSNGFKIRSAYSYHNQSGSTYIYAAFAEHPQKTARAR